MKLQDDRTEEQKRTQGHTIKAVKKGKGFYHADCGGMLAVGGTVTRTLPIGVGFINGRLGVDCIKQKGYAGFCMKCGESGNWYVGKGRHIVKCIKKVDNACLAMTK